MNTLGIIALIFCVVALCVSIPWIMELDTKEKPYKSVKVFIAILIAVACGMYAGNVIGAYGQMRGDYKVTYKVDENHNVTDTIIHVK
jgi:uncharacterized BrkB/YihY/UPF0761 family membrane protein